MSDVTVEWTIRAMGRDVGDVETVERTEFVEALIKQNRVKVIVDHDKAEELFEVLAEEAQSFPTDLPGAAALEETPKPRAPRRMS